MKLLRAHSLSTIRQIHPTSMAQSAKLAIPKGTPITLTHRGGAIVVSQGHTTMHEGDHLTIIGNPDGLSELATRYRGVGIPDDATAAQ